VPILLITVFFVHTAKYRRRATHWIPALKEHEREGPTQLCKAASRSFALQGFHYISQGLKDSEVNLRIFEK